MTNFNERINELAELEAKATPGEWEGYDLSFCDHFLEQIISSYDGEIQILSLKRENSENNQQFICALRNKTLPLLREMQAENERLLELNKLRVLSGQRDQEIVQTALQDSILENKRLRQGIKDVAEKYAEMYDLRDHFYYEMENAQTALLFANRENERLRAGIGKAANYLQHQFGYDDVLALEQEFRQISFGDVTEFMDFMKELEVLQNDE